MNKKLVAVMVSSALAAPMAAQAVSYKASGQVNRAIMFASDGVASDVLHVDGDSSGSRFRFVGSEDIGNGMQAGINMEIETQSNDSASATIKQGGDGAFKFGERHVALWFSGTWGKVSLGQTSDASDGTAFADQSGAWVVTENACDFHCSIGFRTAGGGATGISAAAVQPSYDGGRRDVLRYDTPQLGPAKLAVSVHNNNEWAVGLFSGGSLAGGDWSVNAGLRDSDNRAGNTQWSVSGGFKFSQGTSINLAYGESDPAAAAAPEGSYFYAKLGHDWGNNAVAVDYKAADDTTTSAFCGTAAAPNCGGTKYGVSFQHAIPKAKIDLYAGYNHIELDDVRAGFTIEDIDVFVVGSRIKFD